MWHWGRLFGKDHPEYSALVGGERMNERGWQARLREAGRWSVDVVRTRSPKSPDGRLQYYGWSAFGGYHAPERFGRIQFKAWGCTAAERGFTRPARLTL